MENYAMHACKSHGGSRKILSQEFLLQTCMHGNHDNIKLIAACKMLNETVCAYRYMLNEKIKNIYLF